MRAAIYNPYLDTLGGGERYTLSFAKILSDKGYVVDLEWKSKEIVNLLEKRFNLDLSKINIVQSINRGDGYDLCFWVSDGSIPALKSRKNILHFQVPFQNVGGRSLINKMKLFRINKIVCNSRFTKSVIDKEFGIESCVIYPPVMVDQIKQKRKENIILNVSRFSRLLQSKHQDILIDVFKKMIDGGLSGWHLILVGGAEIGNAGFTDDLRKMAVGYPVDIIESPGFNVIRDLYGKSKLFWSASGFGANEDVNPELVEHFGITVVEAMAGGSAPIIYNAGGHKEIVDNGINGYLWTNDYEFAAITKKLIEDKDLLRQISQTGIANSKKFSYAEFESNIAKIL